MLSFARLRIANQIRQKEWDPKTQFTLEYWGNALGGECGEAQNIIKKLVREKLGLRGSRATVADLADELADVVIYIDLLANHMNIDLGLAVRNKFNATSEKYNLNTRFDTSDS